MHENVKRIKRDISCDYLKENNYIITIHNTGDLSADFYKYAGYFYKAAESVMEYLNEKASRKHDIAKLDLWYFAMLYLYRHSLELLLKASIFKIIISDEGRKEVVVEIRHDLCQGLDKLLNIMQLSDKDNENSKWLLEFFSDISFYDKDSDMFRYPFGHDLNVLFEEQTHISLLATNNNMHRAYNLLKDIYETGVISNRKFENAPSKLFVEGGSYYHQSVLGYKYAEKSYYPLFSSYEEVGAFLKNLVLTEGNLDCFIPMCYMYRNAAELGLKRIIVESRYYKLEDALKIIQRKKHSLYSLWDTVDKEILGYSKNSNDIQDPVDISAYIHSLHNLDPRSDKFRYPCTKKMQTYFTKTQKFDVKSVSSDFIEICNFLDNVDSMLINRRDNESEFNFYYSDIQILSKRFHHFRYTSAK